MPTRSMQIQTWCPCGPAATSQKPRARRGSRPAWCLWTSPWGGLSGSASRVHKANVHADVVSVGEGSTQGTRRCSELSLWQTPLHLALKLHNRFFLHVSGVPELDKVLWFLRKTVNGPAACCPKTPRRYAGAGLGSGSQDSQARADPDVPGGRLSPETTPGSVQEERQCGRPSSPCSEATRRSFCL